MGYGRGRKMDVWEGNDSLSSEENLGSFVGKADNGKVKFMTEEDIQNIEVDINQLSPNIRKKL